jgi:ubiquinone/menaquinone biosynthesis C-methylase UbiE
LINPVGCPHDRAWSTPDEPKKGASLSVSGRRDRPERADYGIDAPGAVRNALIAGLTCGLVGSLSYAMLGPRQRTLAKRALALCTCVGLSSLVFAGGMLWSSRVGKLKARDQLINAILWRGDETVLDVGCGWGLLLIAVAKRLSVGRAIGMDIWDASDESGNRPDATLRNARIEGVAERVEVKDGDARTLPFDDRTFDVVLSSLVVHNIHAATDRETALREMVRVLKDGGHLAILDVLHTGQYARVLRESGMLGVERTAARFLYFFPSRLVLGRKPIQPTS